MPKSVKKSATPMSMVLHGKLLPYMFTVHALSAPEAAWSTRCAMALLFVASVMA